MKIVNVPEIFQPKVRAHFPAFQTGEELEWQAWQYVKNNRIESNYWYLPILWCPYYVNNNYAKDDVALRKLKSFLSGLDKRKRYITFNIYDGWPVEVPDNIVVFAAAGSPRAAVEFPLICDPHPDKDEVGSNRTVLCSFVGSAGTHQVRKEMIEYFDGKPGFAMKDSQTGNSTDLFRAMMKSSVFAMAPRGSGPTSFRLYEALQYGCIPAYISDRHVLPFQDKINWDKLAVIWECGDWEGLEKHLEQLESSGEVEKMREYGCSIYDKYFTYKGCFDRMKEIIERDYQ